MEQSTRQDSSHSSKGKKRLICLPLGTTEGVRLRNGFSEVKNTRIFEVTDTFVPIVLESC